MSAEAIRRARFLRVAERRTKKALRAIAMVGRCSNRRAYKWEAAEVRRIVKALRGALDSLEMDFYGSKPITFTLREGGPEE